MKKPVLIFLPFLLMLASACRGQRPVVKKPAHGKVTEFHREPSKFIVQLMADYNYRGINRQGDRALVDGLGGGVGLFIHQPMRWQWIGHKSLYYYVDVTGSPEFAGNPYPGQKRYIVSTYPGIYMRSYLPFFFKVFYGTGINLRLGRTNYDQWGIYGRAGVELCGFTTSFLAIGHPGQPNWETEYRFGYMMYKPLSKCFGD